MNTKPNRRSTNLLGLMLLLALVSHAWAASEKVLYRFHGKDGWGGGSVILGTDGSLYGTAGGGTNSCTAFGCGVVFRLKRDAKGRWQDTVLHDFDGDDGWFPNGTLIADKAGNLYGTTVWGGSKGCTGLGCGVAFELVRGKGDSWTYKTLYNFSSGGGLWPYAGLIFDSQGQLYGTTSGGGNFTACTGGCGVVFKLTPDGKGNWTESVLYSFSDRDGNGAKAPVIFDAAGTLYGTTEYGGTGAGNVFKLTLGKQGQWTATALHSFTGNKDGYEPTYGLALDTAGNLYGTTPFGGTQGEQGWGTAFSLMPAKGGKWKETILHRFDENKVRGGYVSSGPVFDNHGNLYGTAALGGEYLCPSGGSVGCGVVFKLSPHAGGGWAETVLHSFGKGNDGALPVGQLFRDDANHLFGVTDQGGYAQGNCGTFSGCGIVYEITP